MRAPLEDLGERIGDLFNRMWKEFRESERDPEGYAKRRRLRRLTDEQRYTRLRIVSLREKLDWEEKGLREDELAHGVLK